MIRFLTKCVMLVIGFGLMGCSNPFAPPVIGAGTLAPILAQNCEECPDSTNAAAVLANFKYAYENRDMDVYENCLDDEFIFIYIDQNAFGDIEEVEVPLNGASGDLARTQGLFDAFDEIRLDTWVPNRLEPEGPEIHDGENWEIWLVNFHLSLRDLSGTFNFQQFEANGLDLFKIRKSADGYWRIVVWEDHSFTA